MQEMREDREEKGVGMTSKQLLERLIKQVELYGKKGGNMADALGALQMVRMSIEIALVEKIKGEFNAKD
jgi:hypothetical protein